MDMHDQNSTFYQTVTSSPQWRAWRNQVHNNMLDAMQAHADGDEKAYDKADIWDMDECEECGLISPAHFQSFLKFVIEHYSQKEKL